MNVNATPLTLMEPASVGLFRAFSLFFNIPFVSFSTLVSTQSNAVFSNRVHGKEWAILSPVPGDFLVR